MFLITRDQIFDMSDYQSLGIRFYQESNRVIFSLQRYVNV